MSRRKWLGGNWKCYGSKQSIKELLSHFNKLTTKSNNLDVVLFPPSIYIQHTLNELTSPVFNVGVQNVSQPKDGPFTGELSTSMLRDFGLNWSIVGHSDRRHKYKESNQDILAKIKVLQNENMNAVVCVGETLEEYDKGITEEVLEEQLNGFIYEVKKWDLVVVAYEPVWAIGTGKVPNHNDIINMHKFVREHIKSSVGDVAEKIRKYRNLMEWMGSSSEERHLSLISLTS
ncbi:triosephosphate isomerase [Theileria orientalis strain Shintoku]|uniref:Triosephosphate isomerase n=1 Tax=Theileria orientalis strain Shintoku TaxID=869250 RepID=J4C980_THEOR|nr:triosephosphate isomerase [Theileria orientalis strain Shintoku]BAM42073.1 triosephosphate isomerase [Theileria orientalis strain Shintoku]|eukprot:XP_009692374.1 triosephosphate isomerase [Theileria orientalis strain Shintoku]